ncbi:MAG: alpha/beta fold hydrolase [Luteimonas sp.]
MKRKRMLKHKWLVAVAVSALAFFGGAVQAACVDNVVLVHGNIGNPSDYANTYAELQRRGYTAAQIFRPNWGSKTCAACNDHNGSEETPVENAIVDALDSSCTGMIDVIGHSMGATLSARAIDRLAARGYVDAFVGIAGAFRGLWSCGSYPFNFLTSTCSYWGLSVGSPLLDSLSGRRFGARMYSMKSGTDQVVCSTGICTVGGIHSSQIAGETATYNFATGHFGLLTNTATFQADLIR